MTLEDRKYQKAAERVAIECKPDDAEIREALAQIGVFMDVLASENAALQKEIEGLRRTIALLPSPRTNAVGRPW